MTDKTTTPSSPTAPEAPGGTALRNGLLITGSALVAGFLVLGGVQFAQASTGDDETGVYTADGDFAAVDIDTSAANVSVRYGDVDEVQLDFDSAGAPLRFDHEQRGDTLHVTVKSRGWWIFGLLSGTDSASLDVVLPESLEPVALDIGSSAGEVLVDGDFAAIAIDSSAGNIELEGSAASLRSETSAGNITGTGLDVAGEVLSESSAGNVRLEFVTLPSSIRMGSSAGNVRVALPDGEYEIRTDTSAGGVHQELASTPGADRVYSFESSAGNITLERSPGR
ncbi:DUF4097 domain-containing protein [Herbiconiux sp. CPCC 203407]|uniref:DUF4097 domain-containing protein n=1 Tax=Herbiconiux oxytropis TaxID=2970915 RepID=A0AA42BS99_9MICO|nr:DUF4097 domain-containing protein [Herbiconiux oxytropis]MCS5720673.1 DUF4097 domain-containing protein [Herbiconiux oxytropis]MCS5725000.1 DUF4097 domain-containing protein [Herbiconiux oxytropis]